MVLPDYNRTISRHARGMAGGFSTAKDAESFQVWRPSAGLRPGYWRRIPTVSSRNQPVVRYGIRLNMQRLTVKGIVKLNHPRLFRPPKGLPSSSMTHDNRAVIRYTVCVAVQAPG